MGSLCRPRAAVWAALLLTGCASANVRTFGAIDQNEKTILVPAGNLGLLGAVKDALREQGWALVISSGARLTADAQDGSGILTKEAALSRYKLFVDARPFDICIPSGSAYVYDITIADLKKNAEVLSIGGEGCEGAVIPKIKAALK